MVNIPVVFCFDSRIILGAAVTIKSMLEHAKDDTCYDIRIFHSEINDNDQNALQSLVKDSRHKIKFHYIDPNLFKGAPHNRGSWTEIVYYRLLTPNVLTEYDKAIYSDVDVLFKGDLQESFNTNLEGYEIAAVPTCTNESIKYNHPKRYFEENKNKKNYISSFIVFNNKLMREEKTVDKIFATIKKFDKRLVFFDMDTMNLTYTRIKDLPLTYTIFETLYEFTDVTKISEYKSLTSLYTDEELEEAKKHPIIIHYAGRLGKPWQRKWVPEYYQEYIHKIPKSLVRYTFRDFRKCLFSKPKYPKQHFDVGLVNFFHSQNYGACLTAYALQETIKNLGYNPAFVNEFSVRKKYNLSFGKLFVNKYLKLMPKFNNIKKAGELADTYITGSDQVFRPQYLKHKVKRDKYLLNFVDKNAKKISFSASFGIGEEEFKNSKPAVIKAMQEALKTFDYVSTRECSGVDICKKQLHVNAEWIIDPVFLLEKSHYVDLANESKNDYKGKFVTYVLDKNPTYDELYKNLSEKHGLEPVSIANSGISVEEWLRAFLDAKYIITDSFHGVCFALMFNKKFIAVVNKNRGAARFESLQKMFDLEGQFLTNLDNLNIDFVQYDSNKINQIIEDRKQYALNVLSRELGTKNKTFITNNCTGCGACYNACPKGAIKIVENSEGFLYPQVDSKLCINCGLCKKTCPTANQEKNKNTSKPTSYAVMASDEIRLSGVSSGGASPVFMEKVIKQGGYVVGAIYDDDWRIIHSVSNNLDDIDKFKGSKYYQSNTKNVYKETKTLLDKNKSVLFTGTPCQIAGLKAFLKKGYENLITVDIVCHGVPSYKTFEMFVQNLIDKNEKLVSIDFRSKKNGWCSKLISAIITNIKEYYCFNDENSFMTAFLRNFSIRKSCFTCPFQKTPRQGDITIGDFWRVTKYDKSLDDKKGTSLVVINNKKGEAFFESVKSEFKLVQEVPFKYAVKGNKTLVKPTKFNPNRDEFMANITKENIDFLLKKFIGEKYKGK